jgi:cytochrome c-type biogenesis protein CcmH
MEYLLTALAGAAIAVVVMRLMQQSRVEKADAQPDNGLTAAKQKTPLADSDEVQSPSGFFGKIGRTQIMMIAAGLVMLAAVATFIFRPNGDGASASTASAIGTAPNAAKAAGDIGDVDSMINKLAERLKTDTSDGEGFRMLGWSYVNTGRAALAVPAYKRAVELLPGRADVHAGFGEALVSQANDKVTPEAKAQFDEAVRIDSNEPRARFFLSLHKAQNGNEREALDEWIALANGAPADMPWQADLRQRATKLAGKLGVDIAGRLKAGPAAIITPAAPAASTGAAAPFISKGPDSAAVSAADNMSEKDRQSMIDGMVEGLASKLQASPDNLDGWVKLIRSRVVLKQRDKAKVDVSSARKVFASDPGKLGQINSLAAELGL